MRPRLKQLGQNLALAAASLAITLAVLEWGVFRLVLKPDDVVGNVSINGVVRYVPGTRATFRHPGGLETRVTINAQGWNATRPSYQTARTPGVGRIAVIGDSYVHGAFVDPEQGFPEVMERSLARQGATEVHRYGMDGAPLTQYLHVLRREVLATRPDTIVVMLIHNDFDESYRLLSTRYASSFMKVDLGGPVPREVPPADFKPGLADTLRHSAMFRYLYYETNAYLHFKGLISRLYWGSEAEHSPEFISSGVDIRNLTDHDRNERVTRYVLGEMARIAHAEGIRLVIAMDAVREAIYEGKPCDAYAVCALNRLAARVTRDLALPFLDLTSAFEADWRVSRHRFEYGFDWHWNERGNRVVGEALAAFVSGIALPATPASERRAEASKSSAR